MFLRPAALLLCVLAPHSLAVEPAVREHQRFVVRVPPRATITAPDDVVLPHDRTDAPQLFPPQLWLIAATFADGLTVDFGTDGPFRRARSSGAVERDAALEISIASTTGPGEWAIPVAADRTDVSSGRATALVRAESNGPGQAQIRLHVSFLPALQQGLPPGDYGLTVTATVSANL